ncbi:MULTISPECIES: hypothetical protein [Clostridium]|uniref:hypothetical protein n=1 Tax=Clostridium TaxID=1485 RepID=UPI0015E16F83|nr:MULTISPECIES: hypothetical protein [Clostridium]MBN7576032.1 hypothetical protein [Clostridium beijerinckii]MBN7581135.1 hypothetical protein [Clostridium beijerinckii]MBN7585753.1 hypothetical protein [Clostridium beijerinckii]MBO0521542.1 hypothetical protein [Clostridium beijerinckii]
MDKKISKNENREKLTVLIDKDVKKDMKKEILDLDCSMGEFIEQLFDIYKNTKK